MISSRFPENLVGRSSIVMNTKANVYALQFMRMGNLFGGVERYAKNVDCKPVYEPNLPAFFTQINQI